MKINIFEDDLVDLLKYYRHVTAKDHELQVNFITEKVDRTNLLYGLHKIGFQKIDFSENSWRGADMYFIDGLKGKWKDIITKNNLQKDSVVIVSGGIQTIADANNAGYKTVFKLPNETRTMTLINKYIK